jgi:hypothetical protein
MLPKFYAEKQIPVGSKRSLKMKKVIGLLLVVFMITACGGTLLKSRTANVTIDNREYKIYVQAMDQVNCNITLFVDGTEVAKGTTDPIMETLFISGKYNGIKFDADCGKCKINSPRMPQQCLVYVKGEKVAELSYKYPE